MRLDICTLCGIAGELGADVLLGVCNACFAQRSNTPRTTTIAR